jgi:hypothetical protein
VSDGGDCSAKAVERCKGRLKNGFRRPSNRLAACSALACLEARVAFADNVNASFAADDLAVAVAGFRGFE